MVYGINGDFGIESIRYFEDLRANTSYDVIDLTYNINMTNGFYESLRNAGYNNLFYWKGKDVWELDLRSNEKQGLDSLVSDNVDLFFISTHGRNDDGVIKLGYNSKRDEWTTISTDWKLGDGDIEWLALYSCHSVNLEDFSHKGYSRYGHIFNRLHLILGSHDFMHLGGSHIDVGSNFADNLVDGDTITSAWISGINELNDNHPAVLSAEQESTWNNGNIDWSGTTMVRDRYWGRGEVTKDVDRNSLYWIGVKWVE